MKQRMIIATVILAFTSCALFGAVSNVAAPSLPLYAMKTLGDGKFYVPTVPTTPTSLKIELLFNVALTGDQTAHLGISPYTSIPHWPDGKVDMLDITFILHSPTFGSVPGMPGWDYMADVVPDKRIDIKDVVAVVKHFGGQVPFPPGTYPLTWPQLSVTVVFSPSGTSVIPDSGGHVTIPYATDSSFTVYQSGTPIGALVTFW